MFLALRELRFARARFGLMGAVIALVTVLMVLLTGLSVGLVNDGVSGLQKLPVTAFAFQDGVQRDSAFSRSTVDIDAVDTWRAEDGVEDAAPYGNTLINATSDRGIDVDLAVFGVPVDSFLTPEVSAGTGLGAPDGIVISESIAGEEGLALGDTVNVANTDAALRVVGIVPGQHTFGHVDVAYAPLTTWQALATGQSVDAPLDERAATEVTAIALRGSDPGQWSAAAEQTATEVLTLTESFDASPGYAAESATMLMIRGFLYAIAALVVGAFFAIWVVQRRQEIAVLRALGASSGYVLRDALTQAFLLITGSVVVGALIGLGLGALITDTGMPFSLEAGSILIAAALVIVLGLIGAAAAVVRVVSVDPATALGGNR